MALLKIANLKKSYVINKTQQQHVLKGVNIEFKSGDLVALLGESGCGKSTLINILGGLDMDYTGSVVIKGEYIRDFTEKQLDDYRKKRVGLIFQNYNLIGHSTILENIELAMSISDIDEVERHNRAMELLNLVGLGAYPDKYPSQLSGGQKQRVAIARALANNPTIILADEPTGALDKESAAVVMEILKKIAASGKLVIIVTHSQKVAEQCGRVIKLDNGVIVDEVVINKLHIDKDRDREIVPKNMKRRALFKQAVKNISRNKKRGVLTSIGMAVGIAAMMLILCLSGGLTNYVNEVYGDSGTSLNVEIYQINYPTIKESSQEGINGIDGISSTTVTTLIRDIDYYLNGKLVRGELRAYYSAYAPDVLYGKVPGEAGEVMIGVNFAAEVSTDGSLISAVGQELILDYEDATDKLKVVGIYDGDENNLCYTTVSDLSRIAERCYTKNNLILAKLSDVTYITAVTEDVRALGFAITQKDNSVESVLKYIDLGTGVLTGVGAISMVVAAIMVFIVLYISVSERIKEIGILRAIGARKTDVRRMFIYEAGLLGLIGGLMAVGACLLLTLTVNAVTAVTLSYSLISYNVWYYLLGIGLSVGISVLAGIAPSMKAADLDPVDALRAE